MNKILSTPETSTDQLHVLLIGNNPIEMSKVLEKLQQVRGKRIITEIAFDVKSIVQRLLNFSPNFILIDDNIGRSELMLTVMKLSNNSKTKDIPITVLKNSNYEESLAYTSTSVLDYILKQNLSSEALYNTVKNSLKFRRTQLYLHQAYTKRKGQLLNLLGKV